MRPRILVNVREIDMTTTLGRGPEGPEGPEGPKKLLKRSEKSDLGWDIQGHTCLFLNFQKHRMAV